MALPASVPFLGAVGPHRRCSAPVHEARQVANDDDKTHDALVQLAISAVRNCDRKDAGLLQLFIGIMEYIDKDKDGAPHGGAPMTPKRRWKPTQRQRRARRAAASSALEAAVLGWRGRREAARLQVLLLYHPTTSTAVRLHLSLALSSHRVAPAQRCLARLSRARPERPL